MKKKTIKVLLVEEEDNESMEGKTILIGEPGIGTSTSIIPYLKKEDYEVISIETGDMPLTILVDALDKLDKLNLSRDIIEHFSKPNPMIMEIPQTILYENNSQSKFIPQKGKTNKPWKRKGAL